MKKGEKATITCPGQTGMGGNEHVGSQPAVTNQIEEYTPLTYQLEMIDCAIDPDSFHVKPSDPSEWDKTRAIRGFDHFRFVNARKSEGGKRLALEALVPDKYAPHTTGVHNVVVNELDPNNIGQKWYYNSEDNTFHSVLHPGSVLLEGFNKNIIVYTNLLLDSQRFIYKEKEKFIVNKHTAHAIDIAHGHHHSGATVVSSK